MEMSNVSVKKLCIVTGLHYEIIQQLGFFNDVTRKLEEAHLLNDNSVVNVCNLILF